MLPAFDFTLTDQYGNTHTLSEYKGKTVFLNFWATWCPPCKREMPEIQALYERYGENEGDLIVLGVANPKTDDHPNNSDETQDVVEKFLKDNGYTFPVVRDLTGDTFSQYMISAFPHHLHDRQGWKCVWLRLRQSERGHDGEHCAADHDGHPPAIKTS